MVNVNSPKLIYEFTAKLKLLIALSEEVIVVLGFYLFMCVFVALLLKPIKTY